MATYYVRKTGSNSNPGTDAEPKLTITGASGGLSLMSGGDTLMIGDGTYDEFIHDDIPAGSIGAPTIIQAENQNLAILQPNSPAENYVLEIASDWIVVDGLICDGSTIQSYPIRLDGTASNVTIKNGTARNGTGEFASGIALHSTVGGNTIQNMHVHDNGVSVNGPGHGIYCTHDDNVIEGNDVHDNHYYGIQVFDQSGNPTGNIVRNNRFYNNTNRGVLLSGTGNLFYNNLVYGNNRGIEFQGSSQEVYFNTIYGNTEIALWATSGSGHIARNNICDGNGTDGVVEDGGTITQSHNRCDSGCATSSSPGFTDAGSADFTLTAGSAMIGAGVAVVGITTDFAGNTRSDPPDIGAYEFQEVLIDLFIPAPDLDPLTVEFALFEATFETWAEIEAVVEPEVEPIILMGCGSGG